MSPQQVLVVLILLVAFGIYEAVNSSSGASESELSTALPATAETAFTNEPLPTPEATVSDETPAEIPTSTNEADTGNEPTAAVETQANGVDPALVQQMDSFDYFVLSLSWSPDYCATSGGDDTQQCSLGKKLGFVTHGLWPQYNSGYPSDCSNEKLPEEVKTQFSGLYPNDSLFDHEWEKHGTCTGLSPEQYLTLTRQIRSSVVIPEEYRAPAKTFRTGVDALKQAFEQANPGMSANGLAVSCSGSGRYLKELDVCFARDGQPADCGKDVLKSAAKSCAQPDFLVRNTR
jgi:ribonuclease T2